MPTTRLNDQVVRALQAPEAGTVFYSDEKDKRLQLAVGRKKRTWYATSTVAGRFIRQRLGEWPHVNANEARRLHSRFIGDVSKGVDPRERKSGTLQHWLDTFCDQRVARGKMKPDTARQYRSVVTLHAAHLARRDLKAIARADVLALHDKLRDTPYTANQLVRVLKAVFRFADKHEDISDPTKVVEMYREQRRTSTVGSLVAWREAVEAIPNPYRRAYLLTCAFTGIRRQNLCELRWADLNLQEGTLTIPLTKAGRTITLPLARQVVAELRCLPRQNEFVFYSSTAKSGHLVEPKGSAPGRIHDLRREFSTACASVGVPWAHQKLLLDHTIPDITGRYIEETKVDLRKSAQSVVDHLERQMFRPRQLKKAA